MYLDSTKFDFLPKERWNSYNFNNEKQIVPEEQKCAMDEFFKNQQKKPPWLRSQGALLVCNCPKCNRIKC